ncbi:MAG TPA: penicillin-binding transpeptidase domain-containing protein [Spirochaetota bacterium]|nr:penicillin-binding transpeptidase domain-containing protein [Spirochaetota bacterium]HPI89942.1 penicillin-binding transpeptidase domain-containing protein [Spirochaetota bacterium]HPR48459.1 penicillin-binding transpeptidase domain-containing protein [Spirochaetota bacterium]
MSQGVFRRRVYISAVLFAIVSLFLIARLTTLHFSGKIILDDTVTPEVRRGYIKDRKGSVLAMTIESYSLFADPREVDDPSRASAALEPLIRIPASAIEKKLEKNKSFVWIRRKLDEYTRDRVNDLGIKGLYFRKEALRVYPQKNLASNIIGFVGVDNTGLEGIEYGFNDVLSAGGKTSGADAEYELIRGSNVWLTIDRFIQYTAEKEIEQSVVRHGAKQGAVLVMEVTTGRVLALAHYPNFDPNYYYRYSPFMRRNFSVIDSFEPGSTMKIISLAALVHYGKYRPGRIYKCEGSIDIGDATINCTGIHGSLDMEGVISKSCNVGVIKAVKELKKEELYTMLQTFGFGQKACGDFPGETEGILRPTEKWSGLSKYSIAIGQELSVTSLQLGAAFCAIANGGVMNSPSIIEAVETPEGEMIQSFYPRTKGRVISSSTADHLLKMMRSVVTKGTGEMAATVYYEAAGKTGTSQKFIRQRGVYSDRVISSFIGVAPYNRPEVCVLVFVDDPADRQPGGVIAAPAFSHILDRVLPIMGVKKRNLKAKVPIHVKDTQGKTMSASMPDFRGKTLPEALDILVSLQRVKTIDYRISGAGSVYAQKPRPGDALPDGEKIILYFK